MKVRRRRPCCFLVEDRLFPDIELLLKGAVEWKTVPQALLLCPLTGARHLVAPDELALVATLSDKDWTEADVLVGDGRATEDGLTSLVARQILVGDGTESAELRDGEAALETIGWPQLAAVYHAQTTWSDNVAPPEMSKDELGAKLRDHVKTYGPPPPHFVRRRDAAAEVALPRIPVEGRLTEILRSRMTTRAFRTDLDLPLDELARLLSLTFGSWGSEAADEDLRFLKKTSPSGGGLHPVEAYPVVVRVAGLKTGVYHYRVEDHALELLESFDVEAARAFLDHATAGQTYFAEAHVAIFHVARFERSFWKYRQHDKIYKAVLLDSAHLSQTIYLLAAERGLGAYFTAAINDRDLGRRFGLDPLREGVVSVNGFGIPDLSHTERHFQPS